MTGLRASSVNSLIIIDDEPAIGQFIERIAETVGYRAMSTTDPSVFRDRVSKLQPTHIMMDLQMPQVDGIELIRYLAEIRSDAQVIICSGVDNRVLEHARRLGIERGLSVVATLNKPIRVPELRTILETVRADPWLTRERFLNALEGGHVRPAYQPQIDAKTQSVCGFEALARWTDPDRGSTPPVEFVSFAEENELMGELTASITAQVLRQVAQWDRAGLNVSVSINLSAQNLSNLSFVDWFIGYCRELSVDPARITFELTETAAMDRLADAMDILTRLRLKGVSLGIDDFGTGYSSLVQLRRLPFTEVKIDRLFVTEYTQSADAAAITHAIIALAQALQLRTVAEGVETEEVARKLRDAGCGLLQGFWISRPLDADDVPAWVSSWCPHGDNNKANEQPSGVS